MSELNSPMVPEYRYKEYRSAMRHAMELAKIHDCKYYVYDLPGVGYQCTSERDTDRKLLGEVYPGGRCIAWGIAPGKSGGMWRW